jgi:hypothetical protein
MLMTAPTAQDVSTKVDGRLALPLAETKVLDLLGKNSPFNHI